METKVRYSEGLKKSVKSKFPMDKGVNKALDKGDPVTPLLPEPTTNNQRIIFATCKSLEQKAAEADKQPARV